MWCCRCESCCAKSLLKRIFANNIIGIVGCIVDNVSTALLVYLALLPGKIVGFSNAHVDLQRAESKINLIISLVFKGEITP